MAKKSIKKQRHMSPASRKKISESARKRWALRKKLAAPKVPLSLEPLQHSIPQGVNIGVNFPQINQLQEPSPAEKIEHATMHLRQWKNRLDNEGFRDLSGNAARAIEGLESLTF